MGAEEPAFGFTRIVPDRGSYKQWEEGGVPPTVVFEVLSPGNTFMEMDDKYLFYEEHGVEEYYIYDPDNQRLKGFVREGSPLRRVRRVDGFVSPKLRIRFDLSSGELQVFAPDGRRFLSYVELAAQRDQEQQARKEAEQGRLQAEQARLQAQQEAEQAQQACQRAEQEAEQARQRLERLAAQLRALGADPEA
jgi:hypothetical protein